MTYAFVSYVRFDSERVQRLCRALGERGIKTWLDRNELQPGQRWKKEIKEAIKQGAFFLACFSFAYLSQERTYMNEELLVAIDELRLRPTDRAWFIPLLLDRCEVPDRDIGAGQNLRDLQWADLSANWERSIERLSKVLSANFQAAASPNDESGIIEALRYKEQAVREYTGYPSYEFRQAQLKRIEEEKTRIKPPPDPDPDPVARLRLRTHITYGQGAESLPAGHLRVVKLPSGQGEIAVRSEDIIIGKYLHPLGPGFCKVEVSGTAFTVTNGLGLTFRPNARVAVAKGPNGLLLVGLADAGQ